MIERSNLSPIALLAIVALVTTGVYFPGLTGAFIFDDLYTIVQNELVAIDRFEPSQLKQAFLASPFEFPHNRALSMLSFGLNHLLAGYDTYWYKLTNVLIHLTAGIAIFVLTGLLLQGLRRQGQADLSETYIQWLSLAVAAAWLLHPLNLTPVLYVVQRMTSLSSLFLLWGLIFYAWGRARMQVGADGFALILLGLLVFGPLAFLCKEIGVLLPLFMLVVEICFFRFRTATLPGRRALYVFFAITVVLPTLWVASYLLLHPEWITGGYAARTFSLQERLLTEGRALWFYLSLLVFPGPSRFGFFHDDFGISHGIVDPWTTLPAVLGIFGLLALGPLLLRKAPLISFAILFYFAGHVLESSIIALEPIYEHRNYLPAFGVILAVLYYVSSPVLWPTLHSARAFLPVAICGLLAVITADRAAAWGNEEGFYIAQVVNHPDSPRANFKAGTMMVDRVFASEGEERKRYYAMARHFMGRVNELGPDDTDGLFGLIVLHLTVKLPIPAEWVEELKQRLETTPFSGQTVTVSQFAYLVRCQLSGFCDLAQEDLEGIFEAALRNKTIHYTGKAGIYSAYRAYCAKYLGDYERALEYARRAAATWPGRISYRLELVDLLATMGRFEEAWQSLHKAHVLDTNARFARAIAQAERSVAAREEGANKPEGAGKSTGITPSRGASIGSAGHGS
jgi:tetratricopeptide (TPR) repeat protein